MACEIIHGRGKSCKDAIGGLKNVYFINFGDIGDVQYDTGSTDSYQTIVAMGNSTSPTSAYKYELHLGNDLTQNVQSSPENGTLYFEQVLNLTLKKLSAIDNVSIFNLSAGHPHVVVEDQMGNFMVVGTVNGADVTGGTAVTGNDFGDLNGYTLSFTARERTLANFYTGDIESEFNVVEA